MTESSKQQAIVEKALEKWNGILFCEPAWVARDFLPPGYRLDLPEDQYDVGQRGYICERWLCSTTKADNAVGPDDEGLSYLALEDERLTLKDACAAAGPLIMGEEYAKSHDNQLGRLAKIYDFAARIPHHIHQMKDDAAKVGANPKEEAYYFPEGVDVGPHPETFFGVHPSIVEQGKQEEVLLPYLVDWDSDLILRHSSAELLVPGEGFHLPAGGLHAPGTALTIELQEDSDVFAMLQALVAGKIIPKELLFKDVHPDDRAARGERAVLDQVDWELSGDPYFYENHHLEPQPVEGPAQDGAAEHWIYYNTTKFSGKRLVIEPGKSFTSQDNGVYSVLVWRGKGTFDGLPIESGIGPQSEFVVSRAKATQPVTIENTGAEDLMLIKFFGPDINLEVPMIPKYPPNG
ncbi:MAG: hypothetical protein ACE5R4_15355 [Armatimonadota bacterium]